LEEDLTWRDGLLQNLEQLIRVHLVDRKNSRKGRKKVEQRSIVTEKTHEKVGKKVEKKVENHFSRHALNTLN
jgi:hypothetical protein